jgi:CAAX prenyl protease-like protein
MALKLVRLAGSALVISVAEEMFFRKWLLKYAGFWWMVALFALEHDRYLVGAIAGVIYGYVAIRKGLCAAITAHVLTNLLLGLYVLQTGNWRFW